MRLVTFDAGSGADRLGVLIQDDAAIVDLYAARAKPAFASMLALIEAGDEALDAARHRAHQRGAGLSGPLDPAGATVTLGLQAIQEGTPP